MRRWKIWSWNWTNKLWDAIETSSKNLKVSRKSSTRSTSDSVLYHSRDMALINKKKSKMAAAILNFIRNSNAYTESCGMVSYVYTSNLLKIPPTTPEIMRFPHIHSRGSTNPSERNPKIMNHLWRPLGDLHLVVKFHGDPICHFEIIAILILHQFGLKMSIYTPKMGVLGALTPKIWSNVNHIPKSTTAHHLSPQVQKFVNGSNL